MIQQGPIFCPICQASAEGGGCDHLALGVEHRSFIGRCVEASGSGGRWRAIANYDSEDHMWLEEAFARKFLIGCAGFAGVAFAWRDVPGSGRRELWGWVWAKEVRKVWWDLADRLEEHLTACCEAQEEKEAVEARSCPICQADPVEAKSCEHLIIQEESEALVDAAIRFAASYDIWNVLCAESKEDYVRNASAFMESFVESCSAIVRVDEEHWDGGAPGNSGIGTCVWADDAEEARKEIRENLEAELARIRQTEPEPRPGGKGNVKALAERIAALTLEQGGALVNKSGEELATAEVGEELEDHPERPPGSSERKQRRKLLRWAEASLDLCGEHHGLCVQALEALRAFCAGEAGYRELAAARSRLRGRVAAAGGVGLPHRATNAAATLACFHCCHPKLDEAARLTRHYYDLTIEFARERATERKLQAKGKAVGETKRPRSKRKRERETD